MYCTLWEECKQTQCPHRSWRKRTTALMWYYSPIKNKLIYQVRVNSTWFLAFWSIWKYNSNIFLFNPLGPFPSKTMRCPWILCFDLLPLQYTDLTHEILRFLVYIFLAWYHVSVFENYDHFQLGFLFKWLVQISTAGAIKDLSEKNQMKVQRVVITGHNSWKCIGLIQWLTI